MTRAPDTTLADRLLPWFAEHARDLPWRHANVTGWGVLVSEIMLQQTPVAEGGRAGRRAAAAVAPGAGGAAN